MVWPPDTLLEYFISSCFCPLMSEGLLMGHSSVIWPSRDREMCPLPPACHNLSFKTMKHSTVTPLPSFRLPKSLGGWCSHRDVPFYQHHSALPQHPSQIHLTLCSESVPSLDSQSWECTGNTDLQILCVGHCWFSAMSLIRQAAMQIQSLSTYVTDRPDSPRFMVGVQQLIPSSRASCYMWANGEKLLTWDLEHRFLAHSLTC